MKGGLALQILTIFILALAISLDGFVVGITYGLKKIKISLLPIIIISLASGMTMLVAMSLGNILANFFSVLWAEKIGGIILSLIGLWLLYQAVVEQLYKRDKSNNSDNVKEILSLKIESLGLIINILKKPVVADMDYSGTINNKEAVLLGIALALDAFGAGIAAAMTGYNSLLTAIAVSCLKFLLLSGGIYLGKKMESLLLNDKIKLMPGIILILLGVFKIIS